LQFYDGWTHFWTSTFFFFKLILFSPETRKSYHQEKRFKKIVERHLNTY